MPPAPKPWPKRCARSLSPGTPDRRERARHRLHPPRDRSPIRRSPAGRRACRACSLHPFVLTNAGWIAAAGDERGVRAATRRTPGRRTGAADRRSVLAPHRARARAASIASRPVVRVVGGMASAGMSPHSNALILNDWVAREGGVGLALHGALRVDVVVSQGCRPVGPPIEVTRAEQNFLIELDGQPALERAEEVLRELPDSERERLAGGLYIGRPVRGEASGPRDYLIRNLLGADRERGVIAVGDAVERTASASACTCATRPRRARISRCCCRRSRSTARPRPRCCSRAMAAAAGSTASARRRHLGAAGCARRLGARGRHVLRRRGRSGRRAQFPARAHRQHRHRSTGLNSRQVFGPHKQRVFRALSP